MRRATHTGDTPPRFSSSIRLGASGLAASLLAALLVVDAAAQGIPLPRSAPKARNVSFETVGSVTEGRASAGPVRAAPAISAPLVTVASNTPGRAQPAASATPPTPFIPNPRRHAPASFFTTFDASQKAQVARVSSYLSSLGSLVGNFVQIGPDGSRTTGEFFIQKPGKVRFEYDPPTPIAMIADGSSLAVRDRKLATQDIYPLAQTPLRYLLAERIDLLRDTNVVAVTADDTYSSVTIEEKNPLVGTSRLMLMIGAKDGQLKQWTVTDPQGYDTTVAIYNLDQTKKPDPGLFKIDFTKYPTAN